MDDADYIVRNAVASAEIEGLHAMEEDRILLIRCVRGEISFDDAVRLVIMSYRPVHERNGLFLRL